MTFPIVLSLTPSLPESSTAAMKRHFKSVRIVIFLAVLTIVGAVGGSYTRSQWLGSRGEEEQAVSPLPLDSQEFDQSVETEIENPQNLPVADATIASSPESQPASPEVLKATETQADANSLIRADMLLQEGVVGESVRHYRHLLADAATETAMINVRYRLGLCAEALGNFDEALACYQQVTSAGRHDFLEELAWLGQSRVCCALKETSALQQLLRRWVLLENQTNARSLMTSREGLYLLGTTAAEISLAGRERRLWAAQGLTRPQTSFEPSRYLPAAVVTDTRTPIEIPLGLKMLHQLQVSEPGSSTFWGRLSMTSVQRVLQQLCEGPSWQLNVSPLAETAIRAHTVQLNFTETNADLLFDVILAPYGVAWTFQDGQVHVVAESEMGKEELIQYRRTRAERCLFAALLADSEHELAPAAYLLLGDLAFQNQDLPTARRHFEKVLQSFPRSKVSAEAWFNAAKVANAQGDPTRARQALLGAVDASRGHLLEPVALLLAGRNALLFDEPVKAIRPLIRAVTLAADDDVKALSLLTLASAHLLAGHPEGANIALMEDRRLLQQESYRDRAAILASLARFRAASTPSRQERDGRTLITSLSHLRHENWSVLHDHLLTVEAYLDVGLVELAIPVLEAAIEPNVSSPLRTRMQFLLANLLIQRNEAKHAESVLRTIAEHPLPEVSVRAFLTLANFHTRRHEDGQAETICRDLLSRTMSEQQRISTLRLLGGIYARRGDRQRAVICFSGVAPQLADATESETSESPDEMQASPLKTGDYEPPFEVNREVRQ